MMMKLYLALLGSVLLCASVVNGAGPRLIVPANPSVWFPSMRALGLQSMSEPAWLLILGAGFVLLAHPMRRKKS
jgi:hypothetical protein